MANAFVLPNNHVFVLTGLFQCVRDEDELAAVLGHEMAHNLARHAGERLSDNVLLGILARTSLIIDPSGILYTILVPTLKVVRELPHSRDHEVEADYIGLHLASDACFDPRAAKRVFTSMQDNLEGKGTAPPEFLSSHPSYETRVSNFETWMPEALDKYQKGECRNVRMAMKEARIHAAMEAADREKGNTLSL
jgi:predicted Zn-dependent protease